MKEYLLSKTISATSIHFSSFSKTRVLTLKKKKKFRTNFSNFQETFLVFNEFSKKLYIKDNEQSMRITWVNT